MSFWGRLFAAPEVVNKTVDAVIKSGDALVFTEEEKSVANMERLKWILEFHKASAGSNLARRLISVMFSFTFLGLIMAIATLYGFGLREAGNLIFGLVTETLVVPMGMIITFYFMAGAVHDYMRQKK
jgi:type III secretory pathway component EscU